MYTGMRTDATLPEGVTTCRTCSRTDGGESLAKTSNRLGQIRLEQEFWPGKTKVGMRWKNGGGFSQGRAAVPHCIIEVRALPSARKRNARTAAFPADR